jgi:hypothetical protein
MEAGVNHGLICARTRAAQIKDGAIKTQLGHIANVSLSILERNVKNGVFT